MVELSRLVVEDGRNALTIDLHPGLSIVVEPNPGLRSRVLAQFVDGLGPARSGVHLEIIDFEGRRLAVFRPFGGKHRVVDIERAADLTEQYAAPNDHVDLLGRAGLDPRHAIERMRVTADMLDASSASGSSDPEAIRQLAAVDQDRLWAAAEHAADAKRRLDEATRRTSSTPAAAAAFESVSSTQRQLRRARENNRSTLKLGFGVGGACIAAALVIFFQDEWTARWLVILGLAAITLAVVHSRHQFAASRTAASALRNVGAEDWDTYRRTNGRLADDDDRAELMAAAGNFHEANEAWRAVAGSVPAEWALEHRRAIEALATERRRAAESGGDPERVDGTLWGAGRLLTDRVVELRSLGYAREPFPLLLDEPFAGRTGDELRHLLDVTLRLADHHQVVLATGDAAIEAWAAPLAANGRVGLARLTSQPLGQPA
ncbi:MAG: hypothetical protein S0880_15495 [Actinomycetota bacterium]|nr:hypothetical protein [Actinomycetota bacterium]